MSDFFFRAEPNIIKSNVEVLIQEGLGPRADSDYLLAVGTCQALLKLTVSTKVSLSGHLLVALFFN